MPVLADRTSAHAIWSWLSPSRRGTAGRASSMTGPHQNLLSSRDDWSCRDTRAAAAAMRSVADELREVSANLRVPIPRRPRRRTCPEWLVARSPLDRRRDRVERSTDSPSAGVNSRSTDCQEAVSTRPARAPAHPRAVRGHHQACGPDRLRHRPGIAPDAASGHCASGGSDCRQSRNEPDKSGLA